MINGYNELMSFGKDNVDALVKSSTLAAKGFEELAKVMQAYNTQQAEKLQDAIKTLSACKSPVDFQAAYTQLSKEQMDSLVSEGKKFAEIATTIVTTAIEPLNARVAAFQKLSKAA